MQMELVLLEFFQWNICYPTAAHFSDYLRESSLVCRSRSKQYPLSAELLELFEKYINYFLEISLQGIYLAETVVLNNKMLVLNI